MMVVFKILRIAKCAPINLPSINGWCKNGITFRQFLGKYVRHGRHKLSLNLISQKKRVWLNDHIFSFFLSLSVHRTQWPRVFTYASFLSVSSHCVFKYKYIYLLFITKEHRERARSMCPFVYLTVCPLLCVCVRVWAMWTVVCFWLLRLMFYVYVLHTICHTNQQNNCGNKMTEESAKNSL